MIEKNKEADNYVDGYIQGQKDLLQEIYDNIETNESPFYDITINKSDILYIAKEKGIKLDEKGNSTK